MNGLPGSLVLPWHKAFQPRVGLAWRVPKIKQTVVRAGFGTNYTVGEYAGFATTMAHQPPFTDEQTNQEAVGNTASHGLRADRADDLLHAGQWISRARRRSATTHSIRITVCPT